MRHPRKDTSRSAQFPSTASLPVHVSRQLCRTPESSLPLNSAPSHTTPRQSPARFRLSHPGDTAPSIFPAPRAVPPRNRPDSNSAEPVDDPARRSRIAIRQTLPPPLQIPASARTAPSAHIQKCVPKSLSDFPFSIPQNRVPTSPASPAENFQLPHPLFSPAPAQSSALAARADSASRTSYFAPSNATTVK